MTPKQNKPQTAVLDVVQRHIASHLFNVIDLQTPVQVLIDSLRTKVDCLVAASQGDPRHTRPLLGDVSKRTGTAAQLCFVLSSMQVDESQVGGASGIDREHNGIVYNALVPGQSGQWPCPMEFILGPQEKTCRQRRLFDVQSPHAASLKF